MSTQSVQQTAPIDSLMYARSLHSYAAHRLDPFTLRCWIIQRLMLDDGLEHECAEHVFECVLASTLRADSARKSRESHRERRHASIGGTRSSVYRWTGRHIRPHRPAGPACA